MQGRVFFNADGEILIIPSAGELRVATELGVLRPTAQALGSPQLQPDYDGCWSGFTKAALVKPD